MGQIVSSFFISLDGVVETPDQWHFPYFNDEMGEAVGKMMGTTEAMLMGRVLYEEWAAYWPTSDDEPIASTFNDMPKYVVSRSLRDASWNNTTVISGDVAAALRELKDGSEGDIGTSGSATLVRWLLANGLLDRLNLMVHPIAVGKGARLFEDTPTHPLRLLSHEVFSTGVLNLAYAPADA
ncbi:MAG TPA: dihydrofolate reductase family protein [Pedococcus sp.]|nr:dihydrofolate reductase family protein [Pedococcus sp.]